MSVKELYTLYAVNTTSPTASMISQLSNGATTGGLDVRRAKSAGAPFFDMAVIDRGAPGVVATSTDIKAILDLCLNGGGDGMSADTSGGNVLLTFQKVVKFAARSVGADNIQFTAAQSLMTWGSINASHTDDATIDFGFAITSDGTNPPLAYAGTVTLSGTPGGKDRWCLGPVLINGTQVDGVRSVNIQTGVQMFSAGDNSLPWPTFTAINSFTPTIAIATSDLAEWGNMGFAGPHGAGLPLDGADGVEVFLRKKKNDAVLEAEVATVHISIQALNGIATADGASSSGTDSGEMSIMVSPRSVDTLTSPLVFDTATACPVAT